MNVMIIGGTSGIGLGLARHYLELGARVAVCGRDLNRVDAPLRARFVTYELDIAERPKVDAAVEDFARGGLDLLIVSAGFYTADPALAQRMMATNVHGLVHAFDAGARVMRQGAQLAAIASVAGLIRDYPGASLYSANKRTVIALCELYRRTLKGIDVSVIVPGYVDTAKLRELSGGDASHKPFLVSEARAVEIIARAIAARRDKVVFPWQLHWMIRAFNLLPVSLRRLRRK